MMDTTSTVTPHLISDTMSSSSSSSSTAIATAATAVALRGGAPKFPFRLYEMLDDAEEQGFDHIVSWIMVPSKNNKNNSKSSKNTKTQTRTAEDTYFKVHDRTKFTEELLPKYFPKQTKYRSFLRQLNLYSFNHIKDRKCLTLFGCYFHPHLIRYQKEKCYYITRGSQPTSSSMSSMSMSAASAATTGLFTKVPYTSSSPTTPTSSWWKEDGGLFDVAAASPSPSSRSRSSRSSMEYCYNHENKKVGEDEAKLSQKSFPWDGVIDVVDVYDENDDGGLTSEDDYDLDLDIADDCFAAAAAPAQSTVAQQQQQKPSSSYDEMSYEPFEMDRGMTFMHRVASLSPSEIDTMITTIKYITC